MGHPILSFSSSPNWLAYLLSSSSSFTFTTTRHKYPSYIPTYHHLPQLATCSLYLSLPYPFLSIFILNSWKPPHMLSLFSSSSPYNHNPTATQHSHLTISLPSLLTLSFSNASFLSYSSYTSPSTDPPILPSSSLLPLPLFSLSYHQPPLPPPKQPPAPFSCHTYYLHAPPSQPLQPPFFFFEIL